MIHRIVLFGTLLLLVSTSAYAGPNWQSIELSIEPANVPKVRAALDQLMKSAGADLKGNVSLMTNVAGGASSHSIISAFDSRAEREIWSGKLFSSKAWAEYASATKGMTTRGGVSRMDFVKSWGEKNMEADVFWEIHAFTVRDVPAFVAALETLQASEAGRAGGAQVHLSAVAASGLAPVTHLIAVGFKSEAHAEESAAALNATKEWTTYLDASRKAATHKGAFMIRTAATWGTDG